jgi:hypothetical protein
MSNSVSVTLTVDTPLRIAGLDYACSLYNTTLPEDATPLTPEEYVLFVGGTALVSYAKQYARAQFEAGEITKAQYDQMLVDIDNGG